MEHRGDRGGRVLGVPGGSVCVYQCDSVNTV